MNYSDISLLAIAAIPILYRGWIGFRYGAACELRQTLTFIFGVLVAIRFWQPCAERLVDAMNFDPRWITIGAFVALFMIGAVVAGVIFNARAQVFQSVQRNYFDNILGLVCGLFSGALLGACLLWLATVAIPGKFDSMTYAQSFLGLPREMVRAIETAVEVAPDSPGRTHYPVVTMIDAPAEEDSSNASAPEGSVLVRQRGQIAWK